MTDRAAALAKAIEELLPQALHNTIKYANNRVECDHGRLKARLRPMRGLKADHTATVIIAGHAFIQNLRRGHYDLGVDARADHLRCAFCEEFFQRLPPFVASSSQRGFGAFPEAAGDVPGAARDQSEQDRLKALEVVATWPVTARRMLVP